MDPLSQKRPNTRADGTQLTAAELQTSAASGKESLQELRPQHEDQTGRCTSGEQRDKRTEKAGEEASG